jgi:hypothetical protein
MQQKNPHQRVVQISFLSRAQNLFALDEVFKLVSVFLMRNQFITGLLGKRFEIAHRTGIRRQHVQDFPCQHFCQRFFGFQNRQWTIQPRASSSLLICMIFPILANKFTAHTTTMHQFYKNFSSVWCNATQMQQNFKTLTKFYLYFAPIQCKISQHPIHCRQADNPEPAASQKVPDRYLLAREIFLHVLQA